MVRPFHRKLVSRNPLTAEEEQDESRQEGVNTTILHCSGREDTGGTHQGRFIKVENTAGRWKVEILREPSWQCSINKLIIEPSTVWLSAGVGVFGGHEGAK